MNPLLRWLGLDGNGPGGNHGAGRPLCILQHYARLSPEVECYRSLRTTLELASTSHPRKGGQGKSLRTVLVVSAGPQEGKTTTLINLGILYWELGRRVLLVDCDLRRGCLHQVFGFPRSPGLTEMALGETGGPLPLYVLRPGFSVMTAGRPYDKPGVLLGSQAMRESLALFRDQADIILMDSSPLLAVSDAVNLIRISDGVLLVLGAGRTSRGDAARVRKLLEGSRAKVVGVVLNKAKDSRPQGRSYDRYYYGASPDHDLEAPPGPGATSAVDLERFA